MDLNADLNADLTTSALLAERAITERVRAAVATRLPLRIRGGGSKDFYGQSLHGEVLDMRTLTGIVSYEPSELVVTAYAGTPLVELENLLNAQGQCLPFEPPHFGANATVGGMVASGLSGPARASVGAVRDYVLGVRLLNGQGECLTFGGQVMKNVAGYDVSRLMVGALGTLGVLLEVSLKVLPIAPAEATLCCHLPQAQALDLLNRWGAQPLPLNASCWMYDDDTGHASHAGQDVLWIRLRGARAAVEAACPRMSADVQAQGGQTIRQDHIQASAHWQACREQTLAFFTQPPSPHACLWRLSLPPNTPALDLPFEQLIEWHGGLRWLWAPACASVELRQIAQKAKGHATLFRRAAIDVVHANVVHAAVNADVMKANLTTNPQTQLDTPVFTPPTATLARLQRALKKQFDPAEIFNPHRLSADW